MDAIVNIHHIIGHYFHVNEKVEQSLLNRSKLLSVHISNSYVIILKSRHSARTRYSRDTFTD